MKRDKNIEKFTKYIIKEAKFETPSNEFLNKVMDLVKLEKAPALSKAYKPLISKPFWLLIVIGFIGLSIFILTGTSTYSSVFSKIDLSFLDKLPSLNFFENIHFSNTFTLSFVFFSILVLFQVLVIKNYYNKEVTNN